MEYEIIDSKNLPCPSNRNIDYSRHPFTNNPNQPLQNTNYKNWINMCQKNQQYGENLETFASADTIAGVSAGVIVVGTMLGAFAAPITAGLIISFGTLLPIFWKPGEDPKTVWQAFLKIGNRPFSSPVDQALIDLLSNKARSLESQFNDFQRYFDIWNNNKTPGNAGEVLRRFSSLDADIIRELEQLKGNYYITVLPGYAQVANWHLNLLRIAAFYYDQWASSSNLSIQSIYPEDYINDLQTCLTNCAIESGNKISSKYYKCVLKCRINEYINYCSKTYQEGLNILKNSSGVKWNEYNTYRREMTINVLDLIAVFPNYDPDKYLISTKSQLTREIYTDALIDAFANAHFNINDIENSLTRPPGLVTWINRLDFYTGKFPGDVPGLTANSINYSFTNGNSNDSPIYGYRLSGDSRNPVQIPLNQYVYNMLITYLSNSPSVIQKIDFNLNNQQTRIYDTGLTLSPIYQSTINLSLPGKDRSFPPKFNNYTHFLSYVKTAPGDERPSSSRARNVCFGWMHFSVNDYDVLAGGYNIIFDTIITQIPAVKARHLPLPSFVMPGPGHTGGNLVVLSTQIEFQCIVLNPVSYKIRMRYVAYSPNRSINLTVSIRSEIGNYQNIVPNISSTVQSPEDTKNPKYEHFQYLDISIPLELFGITNITITRSDSISNNTLIIDKIEFTPDV
uniref:Crystaline entomocidal protoxin n=1 Tax=Bacillus thuringiensis TaxID=1428 RepID=K9JA73_BACTU|nr:Cry54 [Bacillus thuringiensis]